jgi:hypothetical protein
MIGKLLKERLELYGLESANDLYKPDENAKAMVRISQHGTKWTAWGAYTNRNYRKSLADARKAVAELKRELKPKPPVVKPKPVPGTVKPPVVAKPAPVVVKENTVPGIEAMVKRAEKDLGLGEPNYIQSWYRTFANAPSGYAGNFAWCNAAVTKWAYDSGNFQTVCHGTPYAYTVSHADRFKANGEWHAMTNGVVNSGIRRGDIIFFDWQGGSSIGGIDHVGLVTSVSGATVYTIEGNISNRCMRKVRYVGDIAGFGRPKYQPVPAPPSYPSVSLSVVVFALTHAAKDEPVAGQPHVSKVQLALVKQGVLKPGFAPGVGDPATKNAYAAYQRSLGYSGDDADGVPGMESLTKLGAVSKLFRVVA